MLGDEKMASAKTQFPHWDLTTIFPSMDSDEFVRAYEQLGAKIEDLEDHLKAIDASSEEDGSTDRIKLQSVINGYLDRMNETLLLLSELDSYLYALVSTDSHNTSARRRMSEVEILGSQVRTLRSRFQSWLGRSGLSKDEIGSLGGSARDHSFHLQELIEQSKYLMGDEEESLAADLALSGEIAWEKLQSTICSQVTAVFERNGKAERLAIAAIQSIRCHDPDRGMRKRAYEIEIEAWKKVREPLAAALNGVKGSVTTLDKRRGRKDALHSSLDKSRISRATLQSMMDVMRESLPIFRKYLDKKADRLGLARLSWWDLFAPVGDSTQHFNFDEASEFIVDRFHGFSPRLGAFAEKAFMKQWIDAEPREGKQGGAFCLEFPRAQQSRVLTNFDGSMEEVITLAHELGHAYHCERLDGNTMLQRITPSTLDETASVFCETIVTDALLDHAASSQEELTILEAFLIDATQTIVDIYSRFVFEREVFERRGNSELSADDFCEMMTDAQRKAYGGALDEHRLHPYMWAWKPHYYGPYNSFYNYPYAFGLLFSLGLYAVYKERGESFLVDYDNLLADMGKADTTELALGFGIDIQTSDFWKDSMKIIEQRIQRYLEI
jgi:pepF/M3 family oligoendopeptidase